jgi:hypothetical protein
MQLPNSENNYSFTYSFKDPDFEVIGYENKLTEFSTVSLEKF